MSVFFPDRRVIKSILALLCAFTAADALASAPSDDFSHVRTIAESRITGEQQKRCLEDFSRKVKSPAPLTMSGAFSYNDFITRQVYTTLYWKHADRGVVFTVPVRSSSPAKGEMVANLACFYALNDNGIEFQTSQQVVWRAF